MFERPTRTDLIYFKVLNPPPPQNPMPLAYTSLWTNNHISLIFFHFFLQHLHGNGEKGVQLSQTVQAAAQESRGFFFFSNLTTELCTLSQPHY